MNIKHWWKVMLLIFVVSAAGVMFIGVRTYRDAPPIANFIDEKGGMVASHDDVLAGQLLWQRYALMEYGSYFGDGALRGPDYTADALHYTAEAMNGYYAKQSPSKPAGSADAKTADIMARARVQAEIKENRYNAQNNSVTLNAAQVYAFEELVKHYLTLFGSGDRESMLPNGYIKDPQEIRSLTAFFFWGGWVCGVQRPGHEASYTHNWPYDPLAGNLPTGSVMLWSVIGALALCLVLGIVLYAYGQIDHTFTKDPGNDLAPVATDEMVRSFTPTATQKASYKFFAVAAALFLVQVIAGVLTVHDYVGLTNLFGLDLSTYLPITINRSWHLLLALYWITACWIGATVFILPMICRPEPKGQLALVNGLFTLVVALVVGSLVGVVIGPLGLTGEWWRWIGHQGWEFVELGRVYQWALYASFALWGIIVYRGIKPVLKQWEPWAMPNWMLYTIGGIIVLFASAFVAKPETNFVIADFWRWMVIHMWVEAFFELFTTVVVAYFLCLMGLVSSQVAQRVIYLGAILFLGSGLLGISHNFYWNAKSTETIALGAVFSSLQVVPLILLTVEAWRFRRMPQNAVKESGTPRASFGLTECFLFLIAVNFWNFMGAGVFGFMINLPIVNYYEHGTYLTVNHGHAALMGVYGNLSVAAMIFCGRYLIRESRWSPVLLQIAFYSMNIGLALMVILDLFPAGVHQLMAVLDGGYWFARSQQFVLSETFQTMTYLRAVGGALFVVGGVVPLTWFMVSRFQSLRSAAPIDTSEPKPVLMGRVMSNGNGATKSAGETGVPASV